MAGMYKKRLTIIAVLLLTLLASFWLGSRYPAIDEKAAMAGETVLGDVLSFDARFPVAASDPLWQKIGFSTLNWASTNRQGMTFGVMLATLILTLLGYWRPAAGARNPFAEAAKGVLFGTPLGVCINCAAPIAYGMRKRGLSAGMSLATMFASPTLNVIVLAMTFSLLPLYMGVTKVVVTLFFIVVVLPLLVRRLVEPQAEAAAAEPLAEANLPESWLAAVLGLVPDLVRSFLFIFIRTVPLMLLAGLLGATMAHLVPLESIGGWEVTLAAMVGVALVGTFAPMPIAFDIVIVQALLMGGLAPPFAMVLLFTLGLYSIYPYLIVSRLQSQRFAAQLFAAVAALGVLSGYGSLAWEEHAAESEARMFAERFGENYPAGTVTSDKPIEPAQLSVTELAASTATSSDSMSGEVQPISRESTSVKLTTTSLLARSPAGATLFQRYRGSERGLDVPPGEVMDFMLPFSQGRGIATGDFDNDGKVDLVAAHHRGVLLYRGLGDGHFEPVTLPATHLDEISVLLVALVDLDNDGCNDLFAGAVGDSDYILKGDCDGFTSAVLIEVPHAGGFMTQAASFADVDRDGDLDILRGSWFFLIPRVKASPRNTNHLLFNQGGFSFRVETLDEINGETLSVLASDLDSDGRMDLVIGNDYQEPDIFHRGLGGGEFETWSAAGPVSVTTNATMSLDTADFDNDGDLDLFMSGKVSDFNMRRHSKGAATTHEEKRAMVLQHRADFQLRYCATFDPSDRERCLEHFRLGDAVRRSTLETCTEAGTQAQIDECMITIRIKNALVRRDWSFCPQIPEKAFAVHRAICEAYADYDTDPQPKQPDYQYLDVGAIPQKSDGNVLLVRQADGSYQDLSADLGVDDAVWAWNARFGDVDLDGWQDLFVVNGWWLETSMYSNVLFYNRAGSGFEADQLAFGLENITKQHAFVYLDLEGDGDLDIVSRSLEGSIDLFINGSQSNNAIVFAISDQFANRFGIGARITVVHGETRQLREIKLGGGFVSFDSPEAYFGLGEASAVDHVLVDWSDGSQSRIDGPLAAGQRYVISRE
jgi:uncharacterized membrane protein YraQ (UPF0718 family)